MVGDSCTGGKKTDFTHPQKTFLTQMFCKLLSVMSSRPFTGGCGAFTVKVKVVAGQHRE